MICAEGGPPAGRVKGRSERMPCVKRRSLPKEGAPCANKQSQPSNVKFHFGLQAITGVLTCPKQHTRASG